MDHGLIPPLKSDQWGGIKGIPTDGGDPGGLEPDSRPDSRADKARLGLADPFAPPATLNFAVSVCLSPSTSVSIELMLERVSCRTSQDL